MTKKDRIAVVISAIYLVMLIPAFMTHVDEGVFFSLPLFLYWGYRFIKNDISFIKIKDE